MVYERFHDSGATGDSGAAVVRSGRKREREPGVSDPIAARARDLHRQASEAEALAAKQRAERDRLIRRLREQDPKRWSYGELAKLIGVSRELIAVIVKRRDD